MTEGNLGPSLTLAMLQDAQHALEATMAAFDADAFVRLGADGYRAYRILKHGGVMIVGGHERGGSQGQEIVSMVREQYPELRVHLTELVPDGEVYVFNDNPGRTWIVS